MRDFSFDDDWPAPNAYLIELGRMTCLWASLESTINLVISKLAGYGAILDYRAIILTAHSNVNQRIDIISALCEQLAPEYSNLRSYKSVTTQVRHAQKLRNNFAHNAFYLDEETGKVMQNQVTARGTLKTSIVEVKLSEVKEATAKIHEAICSLHVLITGKELKPLWERS